MDRGHTAVRSGTEPGEAEEALHQCQLIQNLVDVSVSSLQALRTRCAASNDLTKREIRTLEVRYRRRAAPASVVLQCVCVGTSAFVLVRGTPYKSPETGFTLCDHHGHI